MLKKDNFVWASYADLMTSLFFIMLVLFVLAIAMMKRQQHATEQQLRKIIEIQSAVKELPKNYFAYDSVYKRFSLIRNVEFATNTDGLKNKEDERYLVAVGRSIKKLIDTLKVKYQNQDIKYLVLIEGMSSDDGYPNNNLLSYTRAWAVKKMWDKHAIMLDPAICEIQIAGSGPKGVGRYAKVKDKKNQRILIQVIPKIGNVE
jgi:outer membrane protein OmpA-like peptidoglycan-associated protein